MSNLTTEAGPSDKGQKATPQGPRFSEEQIDTLNQVFALFRLNFHNQYFKAFGQDRELKAIMRLWAEALARFDSTTILRGAKSLIETTEFLPTLAAMVKACEAASKHGLPEAHAAYLEACRAPSPKAAQTWSHLAVYHAGKACDWYFLANNPERTAFPIFRQHYEAVCAKVRLGEQLKQPKIISLEKNLTYLPTKKKPMPG
jgi:hypothetical protein